MTGLEITFAAIAAVAFLATAWVAGVVGWRLLRSPKR